MDNNKDLVWDLNEGSKRQRAQQFVLGFENKLSVYSESVEQLYTNYNIFFPKEETRKLVILPNPYAHHDTFHGVSLSSVKATGLFIVPAAAGGKKGALSMAIPSKATGAKLRIVPLELGLELINRHRPPDKPFLPVLVKGDLRQLDEQTPCLHLHALQVQTLSTLSDLEIRDINRVILARLDELTGKK